MNVLVELLPWVNVLFVKGHPGAKVQVSDKKPHLWAAQRELASDQDQVLLSSLRMKGVIWLLYPQRGQLGSKFLYTP